MSSNQKTAVDSFMFQKPISNSKKSENPRGMPDEKERDIANHASEVDNADRNNADRSGCMSLNGRRENKTKRRTRH